MSMCIYLITDTETDEHRLVRAANQAQAIRHVAQSRFDIEVAGQFDLASLLAVGKVVEDATKVEQAEVTGA